MWCKRKKEIRLSPWGFRKQMGWSEVGLEDWRVWVWVILLPLPALIRV